MNKKGFTLIELLAVIVILAIIALIATPIVLDIISDTKASSTLRSGEFYLDAVEQAISKEMMNDATFKAKECRIEEDGNLLCSELGFTVCEERNTEVVCSGKETEIKVDVSGEKPTEGIIELNNGQIEDIELTISNNSLVMKENNLVFENDTEVIYETDVIKGSTFNLPDIFDYDTIYIVTFINEDFGINDSSRAILCEIDGKKYLLPEKEIANFRRIPLYYESAPNDVHFKIEKTNQKLGDYSVIVIRGGAAVYSSEFKLGNITVTTTLGNIQLEPTTNAVTEKFGKFIYFATGDITQIIYNALVNKKNFLIRMEQEIDGKKVIRQYGGTKPKYQETHANAELNDSYYWGTNFFPIYLVGE